MPSVLYYIVTALLILLTAFPAHAEEKETDLNEARKILVEARQAAEGITDVSETVNTPPPYFSTAVSDKIRLFNDIAIAQVMAGDLDEARITFQKAHQIIKAIHNDIVKIDNLGGVASAQALAGDVPGALQTIDLIMEKDRAVYPLINIAEAQVTAGDQAGARKTLVKTFEIVKRSTYQS